MKNLSLPFLLLLCIGLLSWSSCGNDDEDPGTETENLNYDGPNETAPLNGAGLNTFAAFFPASETQPFNGYNLAGVEFWMEQIPNATSVVIFAGGTNDRTPGAELYRIDLTARVRNTGWVEHLLTTPIEITGQPLWLAVETDLANNNDQAIGCDNGANWNPNGDRFLPATGGAWTSFNEITGSEQIHWNIRGILELPQ